MVDPAGPRSLGSLGLKPPLRAMFSLLLCLACCAGGAGPSPHATLDAFRNAVARNDYAALYALLPAETRRRESLDHFRARMQADRIELAEMANAIERTLVAGRLPYAEVPLAGGGSATAVEDPEGWRVSRPGFGPAPAATYADALRAFRAALERQSLPALLRVLSARTRGSVQAEMNSLIEALHDPASLHVEQQSAQRARIRLPDGRVITLVLEGDGWHIEEVQ